MLARVVCLLVVARVAAHPLPRRELSPYDKEEYPTETIACDPAVLGECGSNGECGAHMIGNTTNVCKCDGDYATPKEYATSQDKSLICSSERKSRTTAILLSVFLGGFGAGSFYLGWGLYGGIAIMLCCFTCLCTGIAKGKLKDAESEGGSNNKGFWALIACLGMFSSCSLSGIVITCLVWQAGSQCVDSSGIECS